MGSISHYFPTILISGLNDGYYLSHYGYGREWGYMHMYDKESNLIRQFNLCGMAPDGSYNEDDYFEKNNIKGYFYDGTYFYNRGTRMVWECGDKYILVDVSTLESLAIYDYICMAEDDLWIVQNGDNYGYIDPEGNEISMYDDAEPFSNGYALVLVDGVAKLIDTELNVIAEVGEADSVSTYGELYVVKKDGNPTLYRLNK